VLEAYCTPRHVSAVCRACYFSCITCGHRLFCSYSHQRRPRHSSTPSSAAALTTVMHCYKTLQFQQQQSVQNAAASLVTGLRRTEHITSTLKSLHWLPIRQRVIYKLATVVHKWFNGRAPEYLAEFCHQGVDWRPGMTLADTDSGKLHMSCMQTSLVTVRSPSLVHASETTYLMSSQIRPLTSTNCYNPICHGTCDF